MKSILCVVAAAAFAPFMAQAADKPVRGPVPEWVQPADAAVSPAAADVNATPVRLMLFDQQIRFDPETGLNDYTHSQVRVQSPQGLTAMGTLAYAWKPDTDTLIFHQVHILRDGKVIDQLAGGRDFTVLRRENNLEYAALNGILTATIQPEGLQVGDIVDVAFTLIRKDPVLHGHAEAALAGWPALTIDKARIIAAWPAAQPVRTRAADLPAPLLAAPAGVSMTASNVPVLVMPQGAPLRYRQGRTLELSDFASWGEVSALLAPLYDTARKLGPASPLHAEIARIKAASSDQTARASAALALVQDQVRYVFLGMNQGSMVPATPDETWQRRFGDCKGKTVLLLALLDGLGIAAEPAVVSTANGDGLDQRLPTVGAFDHVLVRATIGGKLYWLDGTRLGDRGIETLRVPAFGWALPLRSAGARLEPLVVPPLMEPDSITSLRLDASAGIDKPAPAHAEAILAGDAATVFKLQVANLAPADLDRGLREFWRKQHDFITANTVSARFDPATGTEHLVMDGTATMDWGTDTPRRYELDGAGLGWKGDYHRDLGPNQDAPFAIAFPIYNRTAETIVLPGKGVGFTVSGGANVDTSIAKREFRRTLKIADGVMTMEASTRSLAPEFAFADAAAADKALRAMQDVGVFLYAPAKPAAKPADKPQPAGDAADTDSIEGFMKRVDAFRVANDKAAELAEISRAIDRYPDAAPAYGYRASLEMQMGKFKEALSDSEQAMAIDPELSGALYIHALLVSRDSARSNLAIAETTRALLAFPQDFDLLMARANALNTAGKGDRALDDTAAAIAAMPQRSDAYLLRANILRKLGRTADAKAVAQALMTANPDNGLAHIYAGVILTKLGDRAGGDAAFARSIAIEPTSTAYLNRAQNRLPADIAGRKADIDAALKLEPDMFEALDERAKLQMDAKDYAGAIATLDRMLANEKHATSTRRRLAVAQARSGDVAAAQASFELLRKEAADSAFALNNLGFTMAEKNVLLEPALAACRASLRLDPDDAPAIDSLGFVLLRLARHDEAIAAYDRALKLRPQFADSLFGRGLARLRSGAADAGRADLKAAAAADPTVADRFREFGLAP